MMSGVRPHGHALAVERRAVEAVLERAVVDELEELAGHALALAAGEQRAALLHGVGGERGAQHAEERRRDERVEDDRRLHRRALARAEQPGGALGGLARRRTAGSRSSTRAADAVGVAGLDLALLLGEHVGERVALAGAEAAAHAGGAGDEDLAVAVDVHGVLDGLDARVGGQGRGLDLEGDGDALLVGRRREARVEGVHVGRLAAGLRQGRELVRVADGGVVDGALHDVVERAVAEVGGVRVAHGAAGEHAHAHAAALGRRELLDLLAVHLDAVRGGALAEHFHVGRAARRARSSTASRISNISPSLPPSSRRCAAWPGRCRPARPGRPCRRRRS